MFRLLLPPNLAAAALRDGIAVRVELNLATAPAPEWLPALALLQRWCGAGAPPPLLQLTRAQLRELVAALRDQPVFFWVNTPTKAIDWSGADLVAVSEHLAEPKAENLGLASQAEEDRSPIAAARRLPPGSKLSSTINPMQVDGSEHFLAITLPAREHSNHAAALNLLKSHGFTLEPSNRKWWLRDRHKTLNFLATHGTRLRTEFGAEFTPNFQKNTAHLRPSEIVAEAAETDEGYAVTLALRAGSADDAALRTAVAGNRGYLEADGKIFLLDATQLARLAAAQQALSGEPDSGLATRRSLPVSTVRVAEAQEIIEELSPGFQAPATWRARSEALRHLAALPPAPLPAALEKPLRPYQRLGVAWLWHLHRHDLGGILADEMGLGKTVQALGLLSAVLGPAQAGSSGSGAPAGGSRVLAAASRPPAPDPRRAALVVAPASLLENWRREAARFAPQLRVFVHHGEHRVTGTAEVADLDLIITSYGTLARDREIFAGLEFACVVADEAQHIKNRRSQNAAALRAVRARGRFLLTGTPVENSLEDLRSLFEFLLPGCLTRVPDGTRGEERVWFDRRLRAQTAPYILRRTKQSVAPELPAKLEQIVWCELAPAQAALYRTTRERFERELFDLGAGGANEARLRFAALTQLLRLRQICCDPRLVEAGRALPVAPSVGGGDPDRRIEVNPPYLDSAKLEAFRELLAEAIDDGHRVLVFSQFTSLLALLRAELEAQAVAYCYLDGSMTARARQVEVDRFQASVAVTVFLLSLKAGGTGLNLTGADTVVHFDPWWNPAAEAQATDRAHRIGQTRVVTSYKLIAAGTVEEKVLALQDEKRALLADVFEASDAAAIGLSVSELQSLLRV
ncbi:MAG: DEAD/DEAH box helicase [Opitutaceae bacterium]|nr:DEAD/DEAH box helicase [Opitutaceae bacterium]